MLSTSIAGSQKTAPVLDFALQAETKYKYFNTDPSLKMSEKPANVNRGIRRVILGLAGAGGAGAPGPALCALAHRRIRGAFGRFASAYRRASREPY